MHGGIKMGSTMKKLATWIHGADLNPSHMEPLI